ncbi:MAG: endolytic transglycosylase MltG, partial [Eubacteriales bacterium]
SDYIAQAEALGMDISEVITLASIIEREGKPQDFKKISAVFHNRLNKNDKLQSCATLQYVVGIRKLQFSQDEIGINSPYNTYLYAGLPAGPIANPGKQAIEAALYPDEEYLAEGYYFFCSTDPESGSLAFAKTYAEHQKNVAKYEDLWAAYDATLE